LDPWSIRGRARNEGAGHTLRGMTSATPRAKRRKDGTR
jgi:hypothetical protein